MFHKPTERGQALILIALAAIGLFGFAALAIDGSRAFSNKRNAQNAADTAVLTAALVQIRTDNFDAAKLAAQERAEDNGYKHDGGDTKVEVNRCNETGITCDGVPSGQGSQYIRVRIISTIPTTFGRVIGRQTLTSAVEAIARVQGTSSTSSFPTQAVVGLRKTGCAICNNGNGDLEVHNSGVFSNSTDACSMIFQGNVFPWSEDGFVMPPPGAMCFGGNSDFGEWNGVPSGGAIAGAQIDPVYNIPAPTITCSGTGYLDDDEKKVYPGNFANNLKLNNGTYTFLPGNYCFADGVDSKGNVTANDVNFRIDGGEFKTTGNTFTCTNMLVYSAGGSGMHLNGNGSINCTGVTFYMESGDVTWNGNADVILKAPTDDDDEYKGLLIYLPKSNPAVLKINGNSNIELVGSIIAPGSEVQLAGTSDSVGIDTQIIADWIDIQGNSTTVINFNPNNQYIPPPGLFIELSK